MISTRLMTVDTYLSVRDVTCVHIVIAPDSRDRVATPPRARCSGISSVSLYDPFLLFMSTMIYLHENVNVL